jgi:hypothetical protein
VEDGRPRPSFPDNNSEQVEGSAGRDRKQFRVSGLRLCGSELVKKRSALPFLGHYYASVILNASVILSGAKNPFQMAQEKKGQGVFNMASGVRVANAGSAHLLSAAFSNCDSILRDVTQFRPMQM